MPSTAVAVPATGGLAAGLAAAVRALNEAPGGVTPAVASQAGQGPDPGPTCQWLIAQVSQWFQPVSARPRGEAVIQNRAQQIAVELEKDHPGWQV